jgi:serine protease AprX
MRQRGAVVLLVGAVALVFGAANVCAANPHGPKVDDRVALTADFAAPIAPIPVIVFGTSVSPRNNPELGVKAQLTGQATAGTVTPAQLDQLASDPNVAFIAPDTAVAPLARPGPGAPGSLSFPDLKTLYPVVDGATQAWAQGYTGAGVGVAVVDSGAIADDFDGTRRPVVRAGANHGDDVYGHGSLVSHVAAGCCAGNWYVGIAPGANVVSYNVDSGHGAYTSDIVLGLLWVIDHAARHNIHVVNLSLGETTPSSAEQSLLDSVVDTMVQNHGILVVAAAGNAGADSMLFAPANDPFALVVGATDTMGTADPGDDAVTPWSSYGTTLDGYTKPDVLAPGRRIMSYVGAPGTTVLSTQAPAENWSPKYPYVEISGTSFSAPQVAGAAAILFQAHPTWTPGQVKWVLMNTARPVAGAAAGSLDIGAALAYQGTPPDANAGLAASTFGDGSWVDQMLTTGQGGWKQATWNQSTWNANSWQADDWDQATWNANGWKQATWNQATWNQATWNNIAWDR